MKISEEARRKIIDGLIVVGKCPGTNARVSDFVNRVAPFYKKVPEVKQHMDVFNDWTFDRLFYDELKLLAVSDSEFGSFCENYMSPVFQRFVIIEDEYGERSKEDLAPKCLKAINEGLSEMNLIMIQDLESGLYRIQPSIKQPSDSIKNIIFAASSAKPDIVIDNVLENSVRIIDAGDALVYEGGIPNCGITWLGLAQWYERFEPEDTQNKLAARLCASLDSKPEELFFRAYCEYIIKNGRELPALIPQVYLYYDPKTKRDRNGNPVFEHQRMDFLMIISPNKRVVIEIDGIQHYAYDKTIEGTFYKCADVNKYADMMKAHREMTLNGYDVYRFGGKELYVANNGDETKAKQAVFDFLDGLFEKYQLKR